MFQLVGEFVSKDDLCCGYFRGSSLPSDSGPPIPLLPLQTLSREMTALREEERRLDELIQACASNVQQMTEETHNQKYPLLPQSLCTAVRYDHELMLRQCRGKINKVSVRNKKKSVLSEGCDLIDLH